MFIQGQSGNPATMFKKGVSGNSKGRPPGKVSCGRRALAPYEQEFVTKLLTWLRSDNERLNEKAMELGLPHLWGKAPEVELSEEAAEINSTLAAVSQMSDAELLTGLTANGETN